MATRKRKFEGAEVVEVRSRVVGPIGDPRLDEPLAPGQPVTVVVAGFVKAVGHVQTDEGLVRQQRIAVNEGFVMTDGVDAVDLLHKLRAERRSELDALLGREPLEGFPDDDGLPRDPDEEP